jgi:peptidoglycan/LPS O-acetylase OafA/YrhL
VFGIYRLVLALLVALSHLGYRLGHFNPGQWAVVCFFMLSGFLMERQFHRLAPQGGIRGFYLDRFFRIYPLYLTVLAFAIFVIPRSWTTIAVNAVLLPLNFPGYPADSVIITPAWSLACEVQFYLFVPLLALLPTFVIRSLLAASLFIFSIADALPYTSCWCYGFLPGVLFIFLTGIMINRKDWFMLRICYGSVALLFCVFVWGKYFSTGLKSGLQINVCAGYLIGTVCLYFLSRLSPKVWWDQACGLFSYPLFLAHPVIIALCQKYHLVDSAWGCMGLSLLAAGGLVLVVEKPIDTIRYAIRKRGTPSPDKSEIPLPVPDVPTPSAD